MKTRHILVLAAGLVALAAIPLAMAQQKGAQTEPTQGAAAQQAADAQAQAEVDARAQRRAAAAAQKDRAVKQGKIAKDAKEEEEEKPLR